MTVKKEWILLLIIAVLSFILLRKCNGNAGTGDNIDLTPDTLYLPGTTDTLFFKQDSIVYKWLQPETVVEHVIDTLTGDTTSSLYETLVEDSLITAKIVSNVKGSLISTDFKYTPKFPKYITRTDTLKITQPVPVPKEKWGVYIGAEIGGNANTFRLQPTILIKTNKNLQFSAGYEIINKTYNIGAYTKITWQGFIK